MYTEFRGRVLMQLEGLDSSVLKAVATAMDVVSTGYSFSRAETGIAVLGRERFMEIAATYLVVRRTEGIAASTIKHYSLILKKFVMDAVKPLEDIKPNDIRAYLIRYQDKRKVSSRYLDEIRTVICTFFHWAASEGYISVDPAATIKPIKYSKRPRKAISQKELEFVRRSCGTDRNLAIVEMLYSTGCRVSELCEIRVGDVDWINHEITVLGKGSKYRTVYMNAKAEVALENYLNRRTHRSEWLICNERGGGQMTPGNIQKIFREIKSKTGVIVTPHIMRHTMATQAISGGTGVEQVQLMLGHANISTTMIYAEVNKRSVKAAHERTVI